MAVVVQTETGGGFNGRTNPYLISSDGQFRLEAFIPTLNGHFHITSTNSPFGGRYERNHNDARLWNDLRRMNSIRITRVDGGPFDLVIFGNESADSGGYQAGIRVAHALGRPVVTGLKGLSVEDGRLRCEQEVQGGRDVYLVPLPAVVSVLEGINLPRYPSVPAKLRARSKPVEKSTPSRPEPRLEKLRLVVPSGQGKQAEVLGQGPEAAPKVVEIMRELGVA
jgi:hypothetical protein